MTWVLGYSTSLELCAREQHRSWEFYAIEKTCWLSASKAQSCFQLILVNEPDLTLFVGEALVGNEAVDQLVKFNRALANHSTSNNPQIIGGIVLTKFDTIDDKVG